jgi:ankyrin repeat protein
MKNRPTDRLKATVFFSAATLFWSSALPAQTIFEAVRSGKLESVKTLVERDPRLLRQKDGQELTPLHWAVVSDFLEIARYLLEKGAPVDEREEKRQTPLHYVAVMGGSPEMARLLLEKGADPSSEDILKTSVLTEAALSNPKIVDILLASGARLPSVQGDGLKSLLMNSARFGLSRLFERVTASNFDLLQRDGKGQTALHAAAAGGQIGIIDQLLKAGLKAADKNLYGWTPLHFAAERGHKEAAARLLDRGAEIDARTIDGKTAYDLAVELNNDDVAAFLSLKGADRSGPKFPVLAGEYFGQKAPGRTAEQFAVGIVAARYRHHSPVVFTPDGREAYWAVLDYGKKRQRVILESTVEKGRWTPPRLASFVRPGLEDDAPAISPDGRKFFFTSYRPIQTGGKIEKENIWVRDRIDGGWSEPRPLPPVVNSVENIHQRVSVDLEGNLYFSAEGKDSRGSLDIYVSKVENGSYQNPVNLGVSINSPAVEYTPFIAPDGSYLLFSRYNPKGWTLFLSYRTKDGSWTSARDLSGLIPSPFEMNLDCPSVTRDGKYLFFSGSFEGAIDGNDKPFWVDASLIERLRPKDK